MKYAVVLLYAEVIMDFKEMIDFLVSKNWKTVFRDMEGRLDGLTEYKIKRISIDIEICSEVVDTMIHEYLHVKYDEWKERKVRKETKNILSRMTEKEIVMMAKQIFRKIPLEKSDVQKTLPETRKVLN